MKEILGYNLEAFLKDSNTKCTYKGNDYEVWELDEETFKRINNMSEEEFEDKCEDGWWRYATGSVLYDPLEEFIINGKPIKAWCCKEHDEFFHNDYSCLTEYMCDHIGASQPKNVCALAVDLAKINGMTMGKLFATYEG